MKTSLSRLLLACLSAAVVFAPASFAQRQPGKTRGPVSKIYVAETKGETQIQNGDKIYTARQATAFDAPGTVIETKAEAHNAFVYSNGTGLFVDQSSRLEISRFIQEPFRTDHANQLNTRYEPSVSQSNVFLSFGAIGICTSQLISGSSMLYRTPQASINIRGGRVVIESTPEGTTVDLLEGDLTVRSGEKDVGGQILRAGERAIIRRENADVEPVLTIQPIPRDALSADDRRVEMACNARKSVTFEIIERKAQEGLDATGDETAVADGTAPAGATPDEAAGAQADTQEIVAQPTVPSSPSNNIVISPDRLPGT
ncbi:MAG TPA: hypothetical protein VIM71_15410 [Lacunisphaera sp.]